MILYLLPLSIGSRTSSRPRSGPMSPAIEQIMSFIPMVTPIDRLIFKYMFIQFLDKAVYLRVPPLETVNMFIIPY